MTGTINYDQYEHIVLIDESGNSAYTKLSNGKGYGAEDFLNLSAVLIEKKEVKKIKEQLVYIKSVLGTQKLHFADLHKHYEKLFYLKTISENINFTAFATISNKKTLRDENGKLAYDPKNIPSYYHKNLIFLFEKLSKYVYYNKINPNKILFIIENSKSLSLEEFKHYINKVRRDKQKEERWKYYLNNIKEENIYAIEKEDEILLTLADAVASSIYHVTCGKYFDGQQIIEPRYMYMLLRHFYKKDNSIFNAGLKFVHKIENVGLSDEALNFFQKIKKSH